MGLTSVLITVIVSGIVAIIVAVLGQLPNFTRLRRLERIVDVIAKVDDESGKQRLIAIRDRYIAGLGPRNERDVRGINVGVIVAVAGLVLGGASAVALGQAGGKAAPTAGVAIVGVVVAVVGAAVAVFLQVRVGRSQRAADDAFQEAFDSAKEAMARSLAAASEAAERLRKEASNGGGPVE